MNTNRRESRETVFALLFEWSFRETASIEEILDSAEQARGVKLDSFADKLFRTTLNNMEAIDKVIEEHSEKWKLSRISKISLASLRMALCEMIYFDDIPEGASINEAIELVKKYGTEEEAAYTNGILGGYSRREQEIEGNLE